MAIPITLFLVALGARLITAALFVDPAYPDSFYYVNVARELAAAQGVLHWECSTCSPVKSTRPEP